MICFIMREREGKAGGGKGFLLSQTSFTLATSNFQTLFIFEATRNDDYRQYNNYSPTVATYWGTGGARVPNVYSMHGGMIGRQDHNGPGGSGFADEDEASYTLTASSMAIPGVAIDEPAVIRRLTPTECERLQGFPDNWTDGQADGQRYKQMGNAVAVPVVNWIIKNLVEAQ